MKHVILSLVVAASMSTAQADTQHAVQPISGYACKVLKMTEQEALSPRGGVPIRTAPDASAPIGTFASSVLLARNPPHIINGFREVLQLTGQPGWIDDSRVLPFDPSRRCVPSIMSNGRPGIG